MKITVQVFENGQPVGETTYRAHLAKTEQEAVDVFASVCRIDLRYRFLGMRGMLTPSIPNEYLVQPR